MRTLPRSLLTAAVVLALTAIGHAQALPTYGLRWYEATQTPVEANSSDVFTLAVDGAAPVPLAFLCSAATAPATGSVCTALMPTLSGATHSKFVLTVSSPALAVPLSATLTLTAPTAPTGFSIVVTTTTTATTTYGTPALTQVVGK